MPRVDPQSIVDDWEHATQGELLAKPKYVEVAERQVAEQREFDHQHFFDWKVDDLARVVAAANQLELALPQMNERDRVRQAVADYWDRVIAPRTSIPAEQRVAARLRSARPSWHLSVRPSDGKSIIRWDDKACLPLLDPDDAREEAMRVQRRIVPAVLEALKVPGRRVYWGVFTDENSAPGQLAKGMRALARRFRNSVWRKSKRGELPLVGAYTVMESPLGWRRDWHPHLNVILVTDGWLEYAKVRRLWCRNVHLERIEGSSPAIAAALRETIKYSVRAVPEKSDEKAAEGLHAADRGAGVFRSRRRLRDRKRRRSRDGDRLVDGHGERTAANATATLTDAEGCSGRCFDPSSPECVPPALTDWTDDECLEWWRAHKRFRRSRGYGCLYDVDDPEPLDKSGFKTTTQGTRRPGTHGYVTRSTLLESIPGDKSTPENIVESWKAAMTKLLGPPGQLDRALRAAAIVKKVYGPVSLSV